MFRGLVPLDYYAGNYRADEAERPCLGINVQVNGSAGSDFRLVQAHVRSLFDQMRPQLTLLEVRWPTLSDAERVQATATIVGVVIGRFVQIHPFINGTGRTSRLLWTVLLHRLGLPRQASVIRRPGPPYGAVMQAAMNGDFGPAIALVVQGLAASDLPAQLPV